MYIFFFLFWIVMHYSFSVDPECDELQSQFLTGKKIQGQWSQQKTNSIIRRNFVNTGLSCKYLLVISSIDLNSIFQVIIKNPKQLKVWKWCVVSLCKPLRASWIWRGAVKVTQTTLTPFLPHHFEKTRETSENSIKMLLVYTPTVITSQCYFLINLLKTAKNKSSTA